MGMVSALEVIVFDYVPRYGKPSNTLPKLEPPQLLPTELKWTPMCLPSVSALPIAMH
jgi:hypothetical protein